MLYTVSYVEDFKRGWREHDAAIWENLKRTFAIDHHYYVGGGHAGKLEDVRDHIDEHEDLLIRFVNVQPPGVFEKLGEGYRWLQNFLHPDNACYIFGSNREEIETTLGRNVAIQLETNSLFSFCAAAIVLNDRRQKLTAG